MRIAGSKASSLLPGTTVILVLIACFTLFLTQLEGVADDPGLGWHLKSGEWIAQNGIPRTDPFLAPDLSSPLPRPWICDQWLADLLMHALFHAGGWPLLYSVFAAIYIFAFFVVLAPAVQSRSASVFATGLAVLFAFKAGQIHLIIRPVVFSIFFFAVSYRMAMKLALTETLAIQVRRSAIPAVLLFLIWANIHPAFVLGLVAIAAVPLCRVLDRRVHVSGELRGVTGLWGACLLATFVNPFGYWLHESIFTLGASDFFMALNSEWRSLDFRNLEGRIVELMLVLSALGLWRGRNKVTKASWFDVLLPLFFVHQALVSVRFLPFAAIALAYPVMAGLMTVGRFFARRSKLLERTGARIESLERGFWSGSRVAVPFVAITFLTTIYTGELPLYAGQLGPSPLKFPDGAVRYLKGLPSISPKPIAAPPDWGGYLTFSLSPACRPVIDDRNTLLGEEMYRHYLRATENTSGLRDFAERFDAGYLLLPSGGAAALRARYELDWPIEYRDEVSTLFRVRN